jgi:hypothetical protein
MTLTTNEIKALRSLVRYLNDALDAGDERDQEYVHDLSTVVKALRRHKLAEQYVLRGDEMQAFIDFTQEVVGLAMGPPSDGEFEVGGCISADVATRVEEVFHNHGISEFIGEYD